MSGGVGFVEITEGVSSRHEGVWGESDGFWGEQGGRRWLAEAG